MNLSPDTMVTINFGLMITMIGFIWKAATTTTELKLTAIFQGKQLDAAHEKIRELSGKIREVEGRIQK